MSSFASGHSWVTAYAMTCAALWRRVLMSMWWGVVFVLAAARPRPDEGTDGTRGIAGN